MRFLRSAVIGSIIFLCVPAVLGMRVSDEHVTCNDTSGMRVTSVADALVQCAPRLEPQEIFSGCKGPICTREERDRAHERANVIAARVWRDVFDRLIQVNEWKQPDMRNFEYRVFLTEVERVGFHKMRDHCRPRLAYDWQTHYVKEERKAKMFFSPPMFIDVSCR